MKYLRYKRSDLGLLYVEMVQRVGLIESLNLKKDKLHSFISEVIDTYQLVPYHNFTHAFNIAHQLYIMLRKT